MANQQGSKIVDPAAPEGTTWDKPAPTGPPTPATRAIPKHLSKLVRFMEGKIADESLLLDLCVDRCVGIVKFNYEKRLVGSDFFANDQPTPAHFIQMAAPLAVELYKQVLESIKDDHEEYSKILEDAQKELHDGAGTPPLILRP